MNITLMDGDYAELAEMRQSDYDAIGAILDANPHINRNGYPSRFWKNRKHIVFTEYGVYHIDDENQWQRKRLIKLTADTPNDYESMRLRSTLLAVRDLINEALE